MGTTLKTNQEKQPRPDRFAVGQVWRDNGGDKNNNGWMVVVELDKGRPLSGCFVTGGFFTGRAWQSWPMPYHWCCYGLLDENDFEVQQYEVLPE